MKNNYRIEVLPLDEITNKNIKEDGNCISKFRYDQKLTTKSYTEQLQQEINEIEEKYSGILEFLKNLKSKINTSNFDIDYAVEREWLCYKEVEKFLDKQNLDKK